MEGNPTERKPEMTIELVKILEAANYHNTKANRFFDAYNETEDSTWYELSKDQTMMTKGLLEAYEILTGKKVYLSEIEKELELC